MEPLLQFKSELINGVKLSAEKELCFEEEKFFELISESISEAGILDNIEYHPYRNSNKYMKIDGYSWNQLERTLSGIITDYEDSEDIQIITKMDLVKLGKNVSRFLEKIDDESFLDSLEESTDRVIANSMSFYLPNALKFRVVVLSTRKLSDRVKKVAIEPIREKPTSIEIWDLDRLKTLSESGTENEPFSIDFLNICNGLNNLPANTEDENTLTYLCVMPGKVLSEIYDEFGQRLLEANVRTFLDFRSSVNNGIRKALLTEPENFFAYNNGLTCTATHVEFTNVGGVQVISKLDNLQIVNGGQTTASIYFAPREKGGIGDKLYKDIDLDKVFVQMKLTVIRDEEKIENLKSRISQYANTQNSIQKSDLVSNHPFHRNIEKLALSIPMPAGETGLSTKWFYERARGQYTTRVRALTKAQKDRFMLEFPTSQKFSKTDMAKFENTWRMKPHEVKKGAQANLKLLGEVISDEYDNDEIQFKHAFYRELIAKAILFKSADSSILKSNWYKSESGFKAETVTYTLAFLRHLLIQQKKDINLSRIFQNQDISPTLSKQIEVLGEFVREKILDPTFRGGQGNPSEFCKSPKGWEAFKALSFDLDILDISDVLSSSEIKEKKENNKNINEAGSQIEAQTGIMDVKPEEWNAIVVFYKSKGYPTYHKNISLPEKCYKMHVGGGLPSDKQSAEALRIRQKAYSEGFDFI
ncbi:AIPR family protein [Shewanella sp. SM34]|uniref:AIPR family protein n=1 Tax=unclassified Shewanella TaxID=196818 RepID=UPI0021DA6BA8|nr:MULTISPECIES: AIPR family protein [unclassified Shewanella]MCU8058824.1 AIPR family protein [Shewanella sp. SM35]MCU8067755.1 AIPR family protein [Shewanella sp. SM34]